MPRVEVAADGFRLDDRPLRIISGGLHSFRIHPEQWADRLRKARPMGLNTRRPTTHGTSTRPIPVGSGRTQVSSCGFGTGGSSPPQPGGGGALSVEARTGDPDSTA
ncbi:beta-galactosidase [Streptomyces sp. NPDC127117]|uniref:beta-galactosidase n=1 Tax=Streptomyces sp. NPDC127117 TaxID=3345368 RepID=UPI00363D4952